VQQLQLVALLFKELLFFNSEFNEGEHCLLLVSFHYFLRSDQSYLSVLTPLAEQFPSMTCLFELVLVSFMTEDGVAESVDLGFPSFHLPPEQNAVEFHSREQEFKANESFPLLLVGVIHGKPLVENTSELQTALHIEVAFRVYLDHPCVINKEILVPRVNWLGLVVVWSNPGFGLRFSATHRRPHAGTFIVELPHLFRLLPFSRQIHFLRTACVGRCFRHIFYFRELAQSWRL